MAAQAETSDSGGAQRLAVFFRALNVSGTNAIKMAELSKLLTKSGASDVVTYIQSGNAVCTLPPALTPTDFAIKLTGSLSNVGIDTDVFLRSKDEMIAGLAKMDEVRQAKSGKADHEHAGVHWLMLTDDERVGAVPAVLAEKLSPHESCIVHTPKDCVFWLGEGVGKSKGASPASLKKAFAHATTLRNRNTIEKMLALM